MSTIKVVEEMIDDKQFFNQRLAKLFLELLTLFTKIKKKIVKFLWETVIGEL